MDMLEQVYNSSKWIHVYTDGSTDPIIQNGGSGVYICYPDGSFTSRSITAGSPVTNYRAELTAIQEATHLLRKLATTDSNIVILTNSKSSIEGLVCPKDQLEKEN